MWWILLILGGCITGLTVGARRKAVAYAALTAGTALGSVALLHLQEGYSALLALAYISGAAVVVIPILLRRKRKSRNQ